MKSDEPYESVRAGTFHAVAVNKLMPIALIRSQVNRMADGNWYFGFTRTWQGIAVGEVGGQDLPNATVLQIYRHAVGPEPATGLETENIRERWESLEPGLRAEIQNRVGGTF